MQYAINARSQSHYMMATISKLTAKHLFGYVVAASDSRRY
jgi:hypothetical protein